MCYHVSNTKSPTQFQEHFQLESTLEFNRDFQPFFHASGFDQPMLPVIVSKSEGAYIDLYRFGLIPKWVGRGEKYKANTLNARNDEVFRKVSYRNYWSNRCLVVVTGFFEPHTPLIHPKYSKVSKEQKTESWFIKPKTEAFFTLGGIFFNKTVSVITTNASALMAQIHNDGKRQPLILDSKELQHQWLDEKLSQKEMNSIMNYTPNDQTIDAYRTIDGIMNSRISTNVPEAILPFQPNPYYGTQLSMF